MAQKLRLANLELNSSKCELAILGHQTTPEATRRTDLFQEIVPDMKILTDLEVLLVGALVGEDSI